MTYRTQKFKLASKKKDSLTIARVQRTTHIAVPDESYLGHLPCSRPGRCLVSLEPQSGPGDGVMALVPAPYEELISTCPCQGQLPT